MLYIYSVKATYLSRTIEFETEASNFSDAIIRAEETAKGIFRGAGKSLLQWAKDSKISIRLLKRAK